MEEGPAVAVVDRSAGRTYGMSPLVFSWLVVRSRQVYRFNCIFRWQLQSLLTYTRE